MAFKFAPKGPPQDPALAAFTAADPTTAKRLQPPGQPKVAVPPAAPPSPPQPAPPPRPPMIAAPIDPRFPNGPVHGIPAPHLQPPADPARLILPLKKAITLRLDDDVIAAFRATGDRYQTRMNRALRDHCVRAGWIQP